VPGNHNPVQGAMSRAFPHPRDTEQSFFRLCAVDPSFKISRGLLVEMSELGAPSFRKRRLGRLQHLRILQQTPVIALKTLIRMALPVPGLPETRRW
jgi:hypothetical protein